MPCRRYDRSQTIGREHTPSLILGTPFRSVKCGGEVLSHCRACSVRPRRPATSFTTGPGDSRPKTIFLKNERLDRSSPLLDPSNTGCTLVLSPGTPCTIDSFLVQT